MSHFAGCRPAAAPSINRSCRSCPHPPPEEQSFVESLGVQLMYLGYEITQHLGHGCFGTTLACLELRTGLRCCGKVMRRSPARDRLLQELAAILAADHTSLVRYYDTDILYPDRDLLITELVNGFTLDQIINSDGRDSLSTAEWRHIYRAVVSGVRALHDFGIVHGDLKPTNVLVTLPPAAAAAAFPAVKLSDFGLSRLYPPADLHCQPCCCLPHYVAPEALDPAVACYDGDVADLWSLGALLYYVVHGRPPFDEATSRRDLLALQRLAPHLLDRQPPLPRQTTTSGRRQSLVVSSRSSWGHATALACSLLQAEPSLRARLPDVERHCWLDARPSTRGGHDYHDNNADGDDDSAVKPSLQPSSQGGGGCCSGGCGRSHSRSCCDQVDGR